MNTLRVELGDRAYDIHIGQGLLQAQDIWSALPLGQDILIVSDDNVAAHYSATVERALRGRNVALHVVTPGEQTKQLTEVGRVIDQLVAHGARRDATLLALGGGVVGDLSGFAAACYMRGIDFVQLPTSLLAQVDSSVGGKTGVNHPAGKNLIGAFHQPAAVVIDTDTLTTLPDRELSAGLAEVIKTALLADAAFFDWLESHMSALRSREPEALATAIRRCCEIKAAVVARDEREAGERMLLNLGHTFGHAIEKVTGYSAWLHGEAVGTGLIMAAHLSALRGEIDTVQVRRVASVVEAAGLPLNTHGLAPSALREAMGHDKKFKHGQMRFILLHELGRAWVCEDVDGAMLDSCLESFCA